MSHVHSNNISLFSFISAQYNKILDLNLYFVAFIAKIALWIKIKDDLEKVNSIQLVPF